MVPEGWHVRPLAQVVDFLDGRRRPIKAEDRATRRGPYPYYGATGVIDWIDDFIFDEPIILIGEDGENILSRNLPHVFEVDGKVWVNNHAHVVRCRQEVNRTYLCSYLESLDYAPYNTGTAQPKLNKKVCESIAVLLPPLPEQKKIADILSTWDKAIETTGKLLANAEAQKRALMQQLLTGKRRLPGFEGREWRTGRLDEFVYIEMGQSPPGESYNVMQQGMPLLNGPTEFTARHPIPKQWTTEVTKTCRVGDILVCVRGSSTGRMNIADKTYCIGRGIAAIRPHENTYLLSYAQQLLKTLISQIMRRTAGSTFPNIDKKTLGSIVVMLPTSQEQQRIADVLTALDQQIENSEKTLSATRSEKRALMQQLLTGKRRVKL